MRACYHKDSDVWSGLPLTSSVEALCLTQGTPPRGQDGLRTPAGTVFQGEEAERRRPLRWAEGSDAGHAVLLGEGGLAEGPQLCLTLKCS